MYALLLALPMMYAGHPYQWKPFDDGTGDFSLKWGEVQVGHLSGKTGLYRPLDRDTGRFGPPCDPPCDPPYRNFGLLPEARPDRSRFLAGGIEVSEEEAFGLLRDPPTPVVPNDANARRVVVIGTAAEQETVRVAWDSDEALSPWRHKAVFQAMTPEDWRISDTGFQTKGTPVIYYLEKDGTVLHRQDDFNGGASALAGALRDADASYDASQDVDRRGVGGSLLAALKSMPVAWWGCVCLIAAGLGFTLLRRGK